MQQPAHERPPILSAETAPATGPETPAERFGSTDQTDRRLLQGTVSGQVSQALRDVLARKPLMCYNSPHD